MKFYTNVHIDRDRILVRGFENGKPFQREDLYKPYLFTPYEQAEKNFKSITGKKVARKEFDSITSCRQWVKTHENIGYDIYGFTNYIYPYIYDNYKGTIQYDRSLLRVANIDIETGTLAYSGQNVKCRLAGQEITIVADDLYKHEGMGYEVYEQDNQRWVALESSKYNTAQKFPKPEEAANPIVSITVSQAGYTHVFGMGEFDSSNYKKLKYYKCKNERDLLLTFLTVWEKLAPDIVTGWNINGFDLPYMVNRFNKVVGEDNTERLSPWKIINTRDVIFMGRTQTFYEFKGISTLDYLELYKKYSYQMQESYRLDHIAFVVLGERKLDYSEYDGLIGLYRNNYQKFIEYNIKDVHLVDRLEEQLAYISLVAAVAYDAKVNFVDAFTSVKLWDVIIHNYLLDRDIVVPLLRVKDRERQIAGGYVKNPQNGMHEWVVSFDFTSLYPMIIQMYNISPETLFGSLPERFEAEQLLSGRVDSYRDWVNKNNVTVCGTSYCFTRDKRGFLPILMAKMFEDRAAYKNQMFVAEQAALDLETRMKKEGKSPELKRELAERKKEKLQFDCLQQSKKIQLNSLFGATSNPYFRWFDIRLAESITLTGQFTSKWIERSVNIWMNKLLKTEGVDYVIGVDTDSCYMCLDKLVKQVFEGKNPTKKEIVDYLNEACAKIIEPFIAKECDKIATYLNAYEQKMHMKREIIADRAVWTGAKHYALNVWVKEKIHYDEPNLVTKGLETVKSSTPTICREALKKTLNIIMNKDEETVQGFIAEFKKDFYSREFDDIATPTGIGRMSEYADPVTTYIKGTGAHMKAPLVYNKLLKDTGLDLRYQPVNDYDRIKWVYLKMPNPTRDTVVGVSGILPKQLGLDQYIDYDRQWERGFQGPVKSILNAIGWSVEKRMTLDQFWEM